MNMRFSISHLLIAMVVVAVATTLFFHFPIVAIAVVICFVAYLIQQYAIPCDGAGIDFMEVVLAVEEQFGVRIDAEDFTPIWVRDGRNDCTAGEFHDFVCTQCLKQNKTTPRSSWNRMKIVLVQTLGVSPREITKEAWLRRDLDFV